MNLDDLKKPFPPDEIDWKAGATNQDKTKALAMAYIDSRAVMNRLDEVCGPENWQDDYKSGPDGGVLCALSILINGVWITKCDGGENSDFEAVKGGLSDAFKRAAVKWGIGRYLYNVPSQWVECEQSGKSVRLKGKPTLPAWALPSAASKNKPSATPQKTVPAQPPAEMTIETALAWKDRKGRQFGMLKFEELETMLELAKKAPAEKQADPQFAQGIKAIEMVMQHLEAQDEQRADSEEMNY